MVESFQGGDKNSELLEEELTEEGKKRQNERLKEFLKAEEEKDLQTPEGREARCFAKQYAELWKKKKSEEAENKNSEK